MAGNKNLHTANKAKKDEFYTQLVDIEKELFHYREHFKNKVVFCNCDDPYESNFFKYFASCFNKPLELKKLIATCYKGSAIANRQLQIAYENEYGECKEPTREPYKIVIDEVKDENRDGATDLFDVKLFIERHKQSLCTLKSDDQYVAGDFRSKECVELLKQADIVVTNPPFSLFREYVAQLIKYNKKFLIIGSQNAITYKEIFKLIMENQLWLGYKAGNMEFRVPPHYEARATRFWIDETGQKWRSLGNICWFTNLDHSKRHENLILYKNYSPEEYPKYDNYDAINVDRVENIPIDYDGVMGVPITFLDKYNPDQFEILDPRDYTPMKRLKNKNYALIKDADGSINGKAKYARILIRRKRPNP